ncbi:CDP-alcohol phosphatidyltransferase family protein, partial [bacterium]|nr:CDP-alcohol phosphatidyltransferase family protein [bacterium]
MTPADRDGVFAHWPNRITMIRFAGSLVLFAIFAVWGDVSAEQIEQGRAPFLVAFWLFVVVAATDYLDGYLARRDQII